MKNLIASIIVVGTSFSAFAAEKDLKLQQSMFMAGASGIVVNDKTVVTTIQKVICYTSHEGTCRFETEIEADVDETTTVTETVEIVGSSAMNLANALIENGAFNYEVRAGGFGVRASEVTCVQPFVAGEIPSAKDTTCVVKK